MAETIETFVAKLQAEGVEAGKQQAQALREEAEKQAKDTLDQAGKQAEKIIAEAKTQAQEILARGKTDLELAARDAALRLQQAIERALASLLAC